MISSESPMAFLRPAQGKCLGAIFATYDFDPRFFETVLAALLPIHADPGTHSRLFLAEAARRLRESPVLVMADGYRYLGGQRLPYHLQISPHHRPFHARAALLLFEDHARFWGSTGNLTPAGFGKSADVTAFMTLDYRKDLDFLQTVVQGFDSAGAQGDTWQRFLAQLQAMTSVPSRGKAKAPKKSKSKEFPKFLVSAEETTVLEQFFAVIPKAAKVSECHLFLPTQPEDDAHPDEDFVEPLVAWLKKRATKAVVNLAVAWPDATVDEEEAAAKGRKPKAPKGPVTGVGSVDIIGPIHEALPVEWWIFPEIQMGQGALRRRPFHARLVAICTREKGKNYTHILLGGPNSPRQGRGVMRPFETALHLRLTGHVAMNKLCSQMLPAPEEFYVEDRSWESVEKKASPLQGAFYDAKDRILRLEWVHHAPECRVIYAREHGEEEVLRGRPRLRTTINDFDLEHGSAELQVLLEDGRIFVPIWPENVPFMRADEPDEGGGLRELVAHHSGKRMRHGLDHLRALDVFAAQQSLVHELSSTRSLLGAFDVAMDGPLGLRAFADALLRSRDCLPEEAWLYGIELLGTLDSIAWGKDSLGEQKAARVQAFRQDFAQRLERLAPKHAWRDSVVRFYGEGV